MTSRNRQSSMEAPDLFAAAVGATCTRVEGMIRRAGGPPFDASQVNFAIDTIHHKVDRCATRALQKGETQDSIREKLKTVTAAVLRKVLGLDHPPLFRDQIASAFEQQWEG